MLSAAFIIITALVFLVSSCALIKPRGTIILKPSALRKLPGDRPWLFVRYTPYSHREFIVEINTPDGAGAYLTMGSALSATYNNALGAYFSVNFISTKSVGQMAFADFDLLEFRSSLKDLGPSGNTKRRVRLTLGLNHFIRMLNREGGHLEDIPIDVTAADVIEYSGPEDFLEGAESLTADLFLRVEEQIFEHVMAGGREGRYVPYGGMQPVPIPGFGPDRIMDKQ